MGRGVHVALGALMTLALGGCVFERTSRTPRLVDARQGACTLSDFKTDGSIGPQFNVATQTLAYSRPGPDGHYRAYLSDPDGSNERRLTNPAWPENRHQFVVEWHPTGKYLFVEVEKATHDRSSTDAIPGYGAYTDLWLVSRDAKDTWKLVDLPNNCDHAITHAAASPDGRTFAWTERVKAPSLLHAALWAGSYVFRVADFVDGSTPHFENIRSFVPGGVDQGGEVDSVADDGQTIAFYSTFKSGNLFATRIYTANIQGGPTTELSSDSFSQAPRFTPDGRSLVYMSGSGADIFFGEIQGADWWVVRADGTGRRRLTYMNARGSSQSVGHYRLAGVVSFDSDRSFYGGVMTKPLGLVGKTVKVTCDEPL